MAVYVKPMTWGGELAYYVGHEPSNPKADRGHQLGAWFIKLSSITSARCVALEEARRLGTTVVECEHYTGWKGV